MGPGRDGAALEIQQGQQLDVHRHPGGGALGDELGELGARDEPDGDPLALDPAALADFHEVVGADQCETLADHPR